MLLNLFRNGFSTGHGYLRDPKDIYSYSALACIAIQANQNDQHGGQSIVNFVRGLSPYPAATMTLTDDKGREQSAKVYQVAFEPAPDTIVGQLITDRKTMLKIGVADGFVRILSIQLSGKKRITTEELLRGYDVTSWKITL